MSSHELFDAIKNRLIWDNISGVVVFILNMKLHIVYYDRTIGQYGVSFLN